MIIQRAPRPDGDYILIPLSVWEDERLQTAEDLAIVLFLMTAEQTGESPGIAWLSHKMKWPEEYLAPMVEDLRKAGVIHPTELQVTL